MESERVVKASNRQLVLRLLYNRQQLTRKEISDACGLSLPTVAQTIKELEELGLTADAGHQASTGGRKPSVSSIVPDSRSSLGISVSKNDIRFALLNLGKEICAKASFKVPFSDSPAYWEDLRARTDSFLRYNYVDSSALLGVGFSFPGIINYRTRTLEFAPTLDADSVRLGKLNTYFGQNVLYDNDAVLAARTEIWFKPQKSPAVYLLLNRGVGGALISSTDCPFGARAGEFGHMVIEMGGKQCRCGNRGCLETYCSSAVLTESGEADSLEGFFSELKLGNENCARIWEDYIAHLVTGVNNIRCIFDSDVILGGEMSRFVEEYSDRLNDELLKRSIFRDDQPYVRFSNYGEFDSAVGAALLNIEKFIDSI